MFREITILKPHATNNQSVLLIYTGGTLGMVVDDESGSLKPLDFENIIQYIPEINVLECYLRVIAFVKPIDSSDMNPKRWTEIGKLIFENYSKFDGFVIIHGTDTMSYTASALSFMFKGLQKPIIFTGSQLPLGKSRSDARNNLLTSLELACLKREDHSIIREVCIYFDYQLFRANRSKKIESESFNAFHSENYSVLAEVGIDIDIKEHYLWRNAPDSELKFQSEFSEDVFFWKIFPGMRIKGIADTLIKAGFKGIILETFGSGNTQTSEEFLDEIKHLTKSGIYILNVSQCLGGSVRQGRYVSSKKMEDLGVISGKDITSEAAVVKMMHLLGSYNDRDEIKFKLANSLCGELSS